MVEMSETANILHNATAHSLVLMDEVGRGTSHLRRPRAGARERGRSWRRSNRAFTLFATHYFELTELAGEFEGIANVHLDAVESRQEHGDRSCSCTR